MPYNYYEEETSKLNRMVSAFSAITGIEADVMRKLVDLCDEFYVDFDMILANSQKIYDFYDEEESTRELCNLVGAEIICLVNNDIRDNLGVDDCIDFAYDEDEALTFSLEQKEQFQQALQDNPDAFYELERNTRQLLNKIVDVEELLSEKSRGAHR